MICLLGQSANGAGIEQAATYRETRLNRCKRLTLCMSDLEMLGATVNAVNGKENPAIFNSSEKIDTASVH